VCGIKYEYILLQRKSMMLRKYDRIVIILYTCCKYILINILCVIVKKIIEKEKNWAVLGKKITTDQPESAENQSNSTGQAAW